MNFHNVGWTTTDKVFYVINQFCTKKAYHKTLMVYRDARVKDALAFLKEKVRVWGKKLDETTQMIKQNYDGKFKIVL